MRTYHRWLSVLFGILIIWIAVTGLLSHGAAIYADSLEPPRSMSASGGGGMIPTARAHSEDKPVVPTAAPAPQAPAAFTCPPDMTCRGKPAPDSARAWVSFFHHIHAGEEFGAIGTALSILSGFALLFFAISGLWMYLQMYLRRSHRHSHPKRIFW